MKILPRISDSCPIKSEFIPNMSNIPNFCHTNSC